MSRPRPVKAHYNGGRVSSSATPRGAAIAAFRRVLDGDYLRADIYVDGQLLATLRAGAFAGANRVVTKLLYPNRFRKDL